MYVGMYVCMWPSVWGGDHAHARAHTGQMYCKSGKQMNDIRESGDCSYTCTLRMGGVHALQMFRCHGLCRLYGMLRDATGCYGMHLRLSNDLDLLRDLDLSVLSVPAVTIQPCPNRTIQNNDDQSINIYI